MSNLVYFRDYSKTFEEKCKQRKIKFTNKNRKKLFSTSYIPYCVREKGGLNGLFWAMYEGRFGSGQGMLQHMIADAKFMSHIPRCDKDGGRLPIPFNGCNDE